MSLGPTANDMTGVPLELQTWDGMIARMDPDRARAEAKKQQARDNQSFLVEMRRDDLRTLRELRRDRAVQARQVRAHVTHNYHLLLLFFHPAHSKNSLISDNMIFLLFLQKPPVYDEHTVFGQPSHAAHGNPVDHGVAECMDFGYQPSYEKKKRPVSARAPGIVKDLSASGKMQQQIDDLELKLRNGYVDIEKRPLSARPKPILPGYYPRQPSPRQGSPRQETPRRPASGSPRRPLTSVSAYRQAGLQPDAWPLLPSATKAIEEWRMAPKYEEQMLLGHLRSKREQIAPPPAWKMRKFEMVPPRI